MVKEKTFAGDIWKTGLLLIFVCIVCAFPLSASENQIQVLLLSGQIFAIDQRDRKIALQDGQHIDPLTYNRLELSPKSIVYLLRNRQLLKLDTPGQYELLQIFKQKASFLENTLSFLQQVTTPRRFIQQNRARGEIDEKPLQNDELFERLWRQIVRENPQKISSLAPRELLALAAWYHQQNNLPRVAYIMERLNSSTGDNKPVYQQLRNESLRGISLVRINTEVEATKQAIKNQLPHFRNMALLIGINRYDNPVWQNLQNPIRDVLALKNILTREYRFASDDILLLENPVFDEIIRAFNQLKDKAGEHTRLLVYYAGHGFYPPDEGEGYWIPRDAGDRSSLRMFIPSSIILSKLKAIPAKNILLVADSCFSASLIRKSRGGEIPSGFYADLSQKRSRQIITSGGLEPVSDQGGGNHSIFAGRLLRILSTPMQEPLSASELALNLRKEVKNAGVTQTPEYGRLHDQKDESGEFFFVRKEQQLEELFSKKPKLALLPVEETREPAYIQSEKTGLPDGFSWNIEEDAVWWGAGFFYTMMSYQYNQPNQLENYENSSTSMVKGQITGAGIQGELTRTKNNFNYAMKFGLGNFNQAKRCSDSNTVPNDSRQAPPCSIDGDSTDADNNAQKADYNPDDENKIAISGQFVQLGALMKYAIFSWEGFSVQMGGEMRYQYLQFYDFMGEEKLDSSLITTCALAGFPFARSDWFIQAYIDVCFTTFEFGGSLHRMNNEYGRNVHFQEGAQVGISTGFKL